MSTFHNKRPISVKFCRMQGLMVYSTHFLLFELFDLFWRKCGKITNSRYDTCKFSMKFDQKYFCKKKSTFHNKRPISVKLCKMQDLMVYSTLFLLFKLLDLFWRKCGKITIYRYDTCKFSMKFDQKYFCKKKLTFHNKRPNSVKLCRMQGLMVYSTLFLLFKLLELFWRKCGKITIYTYDTCKFSMKFDQKYFCKKNRLSIIKGQFR